MAIQMRRGLLADFDASKMLPGEFAVTIDEVAENQKVFICFSAGTFKTLATREDFEQDLANIQQKRQRQRMKLSTRLTKS